MSGSRVDIYVGKDKKHYRLPKDLLCYYSAYFDRCFNGDFKEAKEGKLELLEDDTEDFDILLEYMLRGSLPLDNIKPRGEAAELNDLGRRYMELVEYADKYDMHHGIGELLYEPLRERLVHQNRILPKDVELVFRVLNKGHKMRKLITQAALSQQGPHGRMFQKQEEDIPDFAQEKLVQVRSSKRHRTGKCRWYDPITISQRTYN